MLASTSTVTQVHRDIAEAERLIGEKVESITLALRRGSDTTEEEGRVRDMRRALELLYEQRRRLAAHIDNGAINISRAEATEG